MIKIPFNKPIQVSQEAYNYCMTGQMTGSCAGQEKNGNYYLQFWWLGYLQHVRAAILKWPLNNENAFVLV